MNKTLHPLTQTEIAWAYKKREIYADYFYIGRLHKGVARATKLVDGEYLHGYLNKDGNEVVPCIYADTSLFKKNCLVKKGNKWGVVNKKGKLVVATVFDIISHFGCSQLGWNPKYALGRIGNANYIIHTSGDMVGPISNEGWELFLSNLQILRNKKA